MSDDKLKTLFHGHSFTANPVACAAALASLDIFLEKATADNISRIVTSHTKFASKLKSNPKIKNIRQQGTILAMEWETGNDTSYFNTLRDKLYNYFLDAGIILRPLGNIIYILPPYCTSNADLDYIYRKIEQATEEI